MRYFLTEKFLREIGKNMKRQLFFRIQNLAHNDGMALNLGDRMVSPGVRAPLSTQDLS